MKKLNAKLSIPKVKAVHTYQQAQSIKNNADTDPTLQTAGTTITGVIGGW